MEQHCANWDQSRPYPGSFYNVELRDCYNLFVSVMLKLKVLYNSIQVHNDTGEYLKQDEFKREANADFAIRGY